MEWSSLSPKPFGPQLLLFQIVWTGLHCHRNHLVHSHFCFIVVMIGIVESIIRGSPSFCRLGHSAFFYESRITFRRAIILRLRPPTPPLTADAHLETRNLPAASQFAQMLGGGRTSILLPSPATAYSSEPRHLLAPRPGIPVIVYAYWCVC